MPTSLSANSIFGILFLYFVAMRTMLTGIVRGVSRSAVLFLCRSWQNKLSGMAIPRGVDMKSLNILDCTLATLDAWYPSVDRVLAATREFLDTTDHALLNVAAIFVQLTAPGATLWAEILFIDQFSLRGDIASQAVLLASMTNRPMRWQCLVSSAARAFSNLGQALATTMVAGLPLAWHCA